MSRKIFLAGASGAIGRRLTPILIDAGYEVFGTTRSAAKADELKRMGVVPVVVDVFDAAALLRSMVDIRPQIVIHQLTDLPYGLDPARMSQAIIRNARLRSEGTQNLVIAALAAKVRRLIAQSIAWVYAPGPEPHAETDRLHIHAAGELGVSVAGVAALERWTLNSPPIEGVVLRYGKIYGPGTGAAEPPSSAPLHVDAAAWAARLAIEQVAAGIYNIAEDNAYAAVNKARQELGWNPDFRLENLSAWRLQKNNSSAYKN